MGGGPTVRLIECVLNDVMGLCASVKVNEKTALISLRIPGSLGQTAESTCQTLLTGMMVYLATAPWVSRPCIGLAPGAKG